MCHGQCTSHHLKKNRPEGNHGTWKVLYLSQKKLPEHRGSVYAAALRDMGFQTREAAEFLSIFLCPDLNGRVLFDGSSGVPQDSNMVEQRAKTTVVFQ